MDIDVRQILLQMLNFGVLFFVLAKFLFRPVQKILDERGNKIAEGLAQAEANKLAEQALEQKSATVLKKAEAEAAKILEKTRQEGKKLAKELAETARTEAATIRDKEHVAFLERLADEERAFKSRLYSLVSLSTKQVLVDSLSTADINKITKKELAKLKTLV